MAEVRLEGASRKRPIDDPAPPDPVSSSAGREAPLPKRTPLGRFSVNLSVPGGTRLEEAYRARRFDVPQFRRLAELGELEGFEVFILGGAAASFAHHVEQEHRALAGDSRIRLPRVTAYSLPSIININTQDIDLVI